MAGRYIPPALRRQAENEEQELGETEFRLSDIEMYFGYRSTDVPAHPSRQTAKHSADAETNMAETSRANTDKLRECRTLNTTRNDQDRLAYIMLLKDAHPFWNTKNEVLCKAGLDLLPDDLSTNSGESTGESEDKGESKSTGSRTNAISYPVFVQEQEEPEYGNARFKFAGYYSIQEIRHLEPRSNELIGQVKAKFKDEEREARKWKSTLNARWAILVMEPDTSRDDVPQIKRLPQSVNDLLSASRARDQECEREDE
ncbi:hypothetical protein PRK78_001436 [Emydomyces testavorans]|uniref:Uncharacterized protein n=1 Tax=Emydomyces testavorans TaxID=2070801 RepID=A0AAF0DE33_9EURO|nr:hypothetical protein PRK78_001436 [Emydomyces testavorans]